MQVRSLVLLALVSTPLAAQNPPVTKDAPAAATYAQLPTAQQVIDRYVAAIGGRPAIERVQSFSATGTFAMPAQGVNGAMTMSAARPNRVSMTIDIPGMGQIVQGYDGTVAWSVNPVQGPRLLEGKELEQTVEDADFEAGMLRAPANVVSREVVEQTTIEGQPCVRVKTVRQSGAESLDCYSVETGLMVASSQKRESPMGSIESVTLLSDYRDFGGVKVATRARVQIPSLGAEQVLTFTDIRMNAAAPAAFVRPAAIETLAKQRAP